MWLEDLWNSQVKKNDTVYILGDFSFHPAEYNTELIGRLNGKKFLILGNHDGNSDSLTGYFKQNTWIKEYKFKDESGETFCFEMCHFPMASWNRKEHGTMHIHGHCHNNMTEINDLSPDLRVDVGLDSDIAQYQFVSAQQILEHFYKKANGKNFKSYVEKSRKYPKIVRFFIKLKYIFKLK